MKIIKQGEEPKPKYPMQVICWRCKSVLEIEAADTKAGQYNSTVVECPVCASYVDVPN